MRERASYRSQDKPKRRQHSENKPDDNPARRKHTLQLLYCLTKTGTRNESKHFCEHCLHGYQRKELLERHKLECEGLLKMPTKTKFPKEGENKVSFQNYRKQIKAPFVIYTHSECLLRKIQGRKPPEKESYIIRTEKHEPWGFAFTIVTSDGEMLGRFNYRGQDAIYVFLADILQKEIWLRALMANKKPLVMTPKDEYD